MSRTKLENYTHGWNQSKGVAKAYYLQGRIEEEPKYIQKEGEFEYLICTEKHITLGNLGNMSFFESELVEIEDQTT